MPKRIAETRDCGDDELEGCKPRAERPTIEMLPLLEKRKGVEVIDLNPLGNQYNFRQSEDPPSYAPCACRNQKDFLGAVHLRHAARHRQGGEDKRGRSCRFSPRTRIPAGCRRSPSHWSSAAASSSNAGDELADCDRQLEAPRAGILEHPEDVSGRAAASLGDCGDNEAAILPYCLDPSGSRSALKA